MGTGISGFTRTKDGFSRFCNEENLLLVNGYNESHALTSYSQSCDSLQFDPCHGARILEQCSQSVIIAACAWEREIN